MKKFDQIIKGLNKTEGRDRVCKTLQYGARFLSWYFEKYSQLDKATQFNNLFMAIREARKIFRLAKSLNEIQFILEIIKENSENLNQITRILKTFARIWYSLFWLFDNLSILAKLQIINSNQKVLNKIAMTFWTIGILTNLFEILRDLIGNFSSLKKYSKSAEYKEMHRRINANCLNLIRNFCDLIPAGTGSEFFQKIFASHPNHGVVGIAGFLAGAISTYQTF